MKIKITVKIETSDRMTEWLLENDKNHVISSTWLQKDGGKRQGMTLMCILIIDDYMLEHTIV